MDPLSIIASIAGISQASASLASALLNVISAVKNAPKEIYDIAKGISDLSTILSELRRVLRDGKDLCRRKLLRRIGSAIRRIGRIHNEIEEMLDLKSRLDRFRWTFRRSKCTQLLYQIEGHKTGINTILHTMTLALQLKILSKIRDKTHSSSGSQNDTQEEANLARQQTENLIDVSYHSIRNLATLETRNTDSRTYEDDNGQDEEQEGDHASQLQFWKASSDDTATWLYDLVFSSTAEAQHMTNHNIEAHARTAEETYSEGSEDHAERKPQIDNTFNSLIPRRRGQSESLSSLIRPTVSSALVVDELLSEWTTLTEDEIEGRGYPQKEILEGKDPEPPIQFKDAVGRQYAFPWHIARTWTGIEKLIKEAFLQVEVIGPHVAAGHYDLLGPGNIIILPSLWKDIVKPGWAVTMHMWPMDKSPTRKPSQPKSPLPEKIREPGASFIQKPNLAGPSMQSTMMPPPPRTKYKSHRDRIGLPIRTAEQPAAIVHRDRIALPIRTAEQPAAIVHETPLDADAISQGHRDNWLAWQSLRTRSAS